MNGSTRPSHLQPVPMCVVLVLVLRVGCWALGAERCVLRVRCGALVLVLGAGFCTAAPHGPSPASFFVTYARSLPHFFREPCASFCRNELHNNSYQDNVTGTKPGMKTGMKPGMKPVCADRV